MKKIIIPIIVLLLVVFNSSAQVTSVKYKIEYNSTTSKYDVKLVSIVGSATTVPNRLVLTGQLSIVVPTGSLIGTEVANEPKSTTTPFPGIAWTNPNTKINPAALPGYDIYAFVPPTSGTRYSIITAGTTEVLLFSIPITTSTCGLGIRMWDNTTDPNPGDPGMGGSQYDNGFTMGSTTTQRYSGNVAGSVSTSPAAPIASVTAQPTCSVLGTITVTVPANGSGITYTVTGTAPVVAPQTNTTGSFTSLTAGNYDVTTSLAGCTSTAIALTVNAQPVSVGGTLAGGTTVCAGTNSSTLTLSGQTGSITKWQLATTADFSGTVTDIANTSTSLTATNLSTTTYYRAVVTNGVCTSANSATATINVTAASVGGTVSGSATICAGSQASDIVLSGNTGSVLQWQSAITADFSGTVTDIASTSTTLLGSVIGNLSGTTYFRAVVQNASCTIVNSSIATLAITITTWDGNAWSNGVPTATTTTIMSGNYSSTGNLYMCSLTVNNGAVVVINPGNNFIVTRKVTVVTGSSLTVESNANLVQIDNIADEGIIVVKRDTNPLKRLDYNLWSTPVMGQNLFNFSPLTSVSSTVSRFYSYNPTTDQYSYIFNPENYTFNPGEGYLIRVPNTWSDTTPAIFHGQFGGVPNNGDYNFSVVSNAYNAIGNPYPSAINADTFIDTNSIPGALYFWRKTNNTTTSSYATYTKAGGTRNTEYTLLAPGNIFNANGLTPNGIIQVGQGFLLKIPASALIFNNAMRVTNNANQFLRTGIEKHRIWLNVVSNTNSNQLLISYMTGATNGVDAAIDGKYVNDCQTALTTYLDNSEYIIQGRALPFVDTDVVPLIFKTTTAGNYEVSIDHVDGLFLGNQNIYIKDNFTGEVHDLKQSAYTYASNIGIFNNRFEIVYTSSPLSTQNPIFDENSIIVYKQNEVLNINSGNVRMHAVKIFDVRGRLVYEQKGINTITLAIKDLNAAQQVLIVQITSEDDKIVSKKIVY